jgi:hypothetical protein
MEVPWGGCQNAWLISRCGINASPAVRDARLRSPQRLGMGGIAGRKVMHFVQRDPATAYARQR